MYPCRSSSCSAVISECSAAAPPPPRSVVTAADRPVPAPALSAAGRRRFGEPCAERDPADRNPADRDLSGSQRYRYRRLGSFPGAGVAPDGAGNSCGKRRGDSAITAAGAAGRPAARPHVSRPGAAPVPADGSAAAGGARRGWELETAAENEWPISKTRPVTPHNAHVPVSVNASANRFQIDRR